MWGRENGQFLQKWKHTTYTYAYLSFKHTKHICLKFNIQTSLSGYNLLDHVITYILTKVIILYVNFEKIQGFHKKIWPLDLVRSHACFISLF